LPSQQFPWVLTRISKLPRGQVTKLAEEFLKPENLHQNRNRDNPPAWRYDIRSNCRLVMRLLTEMQLRSVVALAPLVGEDNLAGNALVALLAESWRAGAQSLERGSIEDGRPITIRAMGRSFHRPYETMRRALRKLADMDLIELCDDGVVLRRNIATHPAIREYLVQMHDIMVTLLDDVFVFARIPLPPFAKGSETRDGLILAALDLHLLGAEAMDGLIADWTGLLVISAITAGNTREITYHPELAFTYAAADAIPPMHLRRPVLFKNLCETLPICATTAWRRVTVLKMLGAVKTVDGGLVNDSKWFGNSKIVDSVCNMVERMHHIIGKIPLDISQGFSPESLYINGRVAPVAL
jgi:hypothetical protein